MKKYILEIKEEAKNDIFESYLWYEKEQSGLGEKFLSCLRNTFDSIQKNPRIYKVNYNLFHQALVKKFPFVVMYKIEGKSVIVFAVFHTSKKPIEII
jgi:toxin ParE1/3/4